MKKIIITTIILILLFIFIVPPYYELNNLAIIDQVGAEKINKTYNIYFREIIPTKSENGITYKYKIYSVKTKNLNKATTLIEQKAKKKLYLNKVKLIITNTQSNKINKALNINPKIIYHTKDIRKKIKSIQ